MNKILSIILSIAMLGQVNYFNNSYKENIEKELIKQAEKQIETFLYFYNFDQIQDKSIKFEEDRFNYLTSYYNKDYMYIELREDEVNVSGVSPIFESWSFEFIDKDKKSLSHNIYTNMPIRNNNFSKSFKFSPDQISGFKISLNRHVYQAFYAKEYKFSFEESTSKKGFELPAAYKINQELYSQTSQLDPKDFLSTEHMDEEYILKLKELSSNIINESMDDYTKLASIHNWLSSNIYYDQDSLDFSRRGPNDGKATFENKKAVCEGYAKLSLDLCRVNQIPCQLIYGYALGVEDEDKKWNSSNLESSPNHAWNQAYVDGRWVIFDTTWDSNNKFKAGQFLEDKPSLNYFDPSLRFFSESHRIDKIIDI